VFAFKMSLSRRQPSFSLLKNPPPLLDACEASSTPAAILFVRYFRYINTFFLFLIMGVLLPLTSPIVKDSSLWLRRAFLAETVVKRIEPFLFSGWCFDGFSLPAWLPLPKRQGPPTWLLQWDRDLFFRKKSSIVLASPSLFAGYIRKAPCLATSLTLPQDCTNLSLLPP